MGTSSHATARAASAPVLQINNLHVHYETANDAVKAVSGVNLTLKAGERLALVGESGCGKTTLALAIMRLLRPPARIAQGEVWLEGRDLLKLDEEEMRLARLADVSLVTQAAMNALNPVMRNVPSAVRLANKMADYHIHWFEEPVPPESWKALKQVREQVKTPLCTGERLHTRWEFVPIFEGGLADFVMPDVTWTGGISELKKIATMAEAYYIPISPHDASGPINVMAGAQVMMTVPNFYKLEVHRYDLSGYNLLIDHPLVVREGCLYVPDRPGLGVALNLETLQQYEVPPEQAANV